MHASINRRTATKVKNGRVQRKNNHRPTGHEGLVLDRESPGRGCVHVVSKQDVQAFLEIIPDRERYSKRLERIVLAMKDSSFDGLYKFYHREETGAIFLRAWEEDLWVELSNSYFEAHRKILDALGVASEQREEIVICRFTKAQARAFMLLHVFMHELGHHYDFIHQKHRGVSKGEDYAESFANARFSHLFDGYVRVFGDPRRS